MNKALLVRPKIGDPSTSTPVAVDFRYCAGEPMSEVCNLTLPCDAHGLISPDGVLMLIAYLKRIVEPYAAT